MATPYLRNSAALGILLVSVISAADPPRDLARRIADRETLSEQARARYLYQQKVLVEEFDRRNFKAGEYSEHREVVLLPNGERTERPVRKPSDSLVRLKLTAEDFHDVREIQPLLLTRDRLWLYATHARGEETIDGIPCWVLEVKPRQILDGQRLFEGILWAAQTDFSVIRSQGRAVPQLLSTKEENLFPIFTTFRQRMENGFWFPTVSVADDTLPFRTGPLRLRMKIEFANYQRFGSESSIQFEKSNP